MTRSKLDQGSWKVSWGAVIFKAAFLLRTMGPLFVKLISRMQIPPLVPTHLLEFADQKITPISGL